MDSEYIPHHQAALQNHQPIAESQHRVASPLSSTISLGSSAPYSATSSTLDPLPSNRAEIAAATSAHPEADPPNSGADSPGGRQKRKRNRKTLSCEQCRRRKVKCDRTSPCGHCLHRHLPCEWKKGQPNRIWTAEELQERMQRDDEERYQTALADRGPNGSPSLTGPVLPALPGTIDSRSMGPSQTPPTSYPPRQAPPARPRPLSLDACVSSQPFSPPPPQQYTWQPFESPQPMDVRHIPASANLWYPPTVEPVTYPPLPPTSQPSSLPYVDVAGGLGNTPQEGNFSRAPPVSLEPWATIQPFFSPPWESPISAPIFSTDSGSNSAPASFRQQTDVVHRPSIPHRHPDTA